MIFWLGRNRSGQKSVVGAFGRVPKLRKAEIERAHRQDDGGFARTAFTVYSITAAAWRIFCVYLSVFNSKSHNILFVLKAFVLFFAQCDRLRSPKNYASGLTAHMATQVTFSLRVRNNDGEQTPEEK